MGKNKRALEEAEYKKIKASYRLNKSINVGKPEEDIVALVAMRYGRSVQTVARVVETRNYNRYKFFSSIESRRNPVTTLGKQVRDLKKRTAKVEAHLYGIGEVKASEL